MFQLLAGQLVLCGEQVSAPEQFPMYNSLWQHHDSHIQQAMQPVEREE